MTFRLSLLFHLAHPRAKEIIQADTSRTNIDKEMDIEFLNDQKFDRKMVMGSQDQNYKKRYQRKLNKFQKDADRAQRWQEEKAAAGSKKRAAIDNIEDDDDTDQDFAPTQRKKPRSKYCPVVLPRKILEGDQVSQMADRNAETYRSGKCCCHPPGCQVS